MRNVTVKDLRGSDGCIFFRSDRNLGTSWLIGFHTLSFFYCVSQICILNHLRYYILLKMRVENAKWTFTVTEHVARKIQSCGLHLVLLVLRRNDYDQAVCMGVDLQKLATASKGGPCSRPRLCHISQSPQCGLGMALTSVEGHKGQHILSIVTDGPAEMAGVTSGDRLVWMNGVATSTLKHSFLNKSLKKGVDSVTVLVIDGESQSCYVRRKMPIMPVLAEPCCLPHSAKTVHLVKGPDGFGFLLRQEKLPLTQQTVHLLREVDEGSPAEDAGVEDGDLLLAVNGEPVESMEHEDIVKIIRKSGDRVSLTTISIPGRAFFRQLGVSPLFFHDEYIHQDGRVPGQTGAQTTQLQRVGNALL
ncbi:Na(+)/H(+) exchange regulatory cofactor NHE-RF3-like isoform X2 [Entelurus aequoreus]|uniref:Na(+)/H(+) exchange regulatory cofactor NHE-RF3-like isoform X2 n=1 Tax=Entelurus aequoreus TaxID=161455 RepID=UPI002B1D837A|nr:Na(+)/H(+) exchange regulatory cofactor NHE-RF3-like isoform X2 [Entelurus aequoreus]